MKLWTLIGFALLSFFAFTPAIAAETITYTYDAKGRLVKVVRTGSINNGVTTEVIHDKANNRSRVKVSGAP